MRFTTERDQPRIFFRVCNLIIVAVLRISVSISDRFGCLEVSFGVVSVMELLWGEQNAGKWLIAFQ